MKRHLFLAAAIIISAMTSCADRDVTRTLKDVESYISERPDSALAVLDSISGTEIRSRKAEAKFALLYSMALDKNFIDSDDDTMILKAVVFYDNSRDKYHKMLAYYYLARIEENAQNYSKAIVSLLKAEDIAKTIDEHFYLGLIYRSMSDIYNLIYNNAESMKYAKKEYEQFTMAGAETHIDWALWDIGRVYHNGLDYESSLKTAYCIVDSGIAKNNALLTVEGFRLAGISHLANSQFMESIDDYNNIIKIDSCALTVEDYRNIGLSYMGIGLTEEARQYMNIVAEQDSTQQWLPYEISKKAGDYKAALLSLEEEHRFQDLILRKVINQNITESVSNYRYYENLMHEKDFRHEKTTKIIYIIILIAIITIGSIIMSMQFKSQKKEIENNMLLVSNLGCLLKVKETEAESLQNEINSLFEQRFTVIDKLSSTYYEYQGTINEKHKIYNEVMNLVSDLGSDKKTLKELEQFVNKYKHNLMYRFRQEFPEMKESDCILYLYTIAGFSARAISIFINEKIEIVYNRKSRLKQKINRSFSKDKELFSSYL